MKNQPGTMNNHENRPGTMKNMKNNLELWKTMKNNLEPWKTNLVRKRSFFVTNAGSQLTFITQNEKVLIFCYQRGVTTDILDV